MVRASTILALCLLAGCASFDPPVAGDHQSVKYQTDLMRCHKTASAKAARTANATPQSAVAAMFASDEPERQDVTTCMRMRGYALK